MGDQGCALGVVLIQMEFMNDAMRKRCENDAQCCHEHQAHKHAVPGKEQFTDGSFRNDIRTDAAKTNSAYTT